VLTATLCSALPPSCVGAFGFSAYFNKGKFNMEDVLNATLAGGVIIGTTADMMYMPWQSMLVGLIGGMVSSLGFNSKLPTWGIEDSCGVQYLHGIPGILGGIAGFIMTLCLRKDAS
jgi:ammonium transporter Rh